MTAVSAGLTYARIMRSNTGRKRLLVSLGALIAVSAGFALADTKPQMKKLAVGPLTLTSTPIGQFGRAGLGGRTGELEWRGGLILQSSHRNFGGWSGLAMEPNGRRFVTVSDAGAWMSGEIVYDAKSRPSGLENVHIGPLLTLQGTSLERGRDRDAEAVALAGGTLDKGSLLVAFEQNARIARYDFTAQGVSPTRGFLSLPQAAQRLRSNTGFEAMTVLRGGPFKGAVIAFGERLQDEDENRLGWIWAQESVEPVRLTDIGDFDISDVASLEDGSIIVLERRFRWMEGMQIRLRLVKAADLASSKPMQGDVLLEADLASEIDNMEGLGVSREPDGTLVLTMISDDNFNRFLQRTILLQFAYRDDPAKAVAMTRSR